MGQLVEDGSITSERVRVAFSTVPRELFLGLADPPIDVGRVYSDESLGIKRDAKGSYTSASTRPSQLARIIEMVQLERGARVLDVGTGSGYTAALLAEVVGSTGKVISIDVDPELVAAAADALSRIAAAHVDVHEGDALVGYPAAAPYDAIIVTCHVHEIPVAWLDQLHDGGRLVVPLTLGQYTHCSPIVCMRRVSNRLIGERTIAGSFLPATGGLAHPPIAGESVTTEIRTDEDRLLGALRVPRGAQKAPEPDRGWFERPRLSRFGRPLTHDEFCGLFVHLTLWFGDLVILYGFDRALGFRGVGLADRFEAPDSTTVVTRQGLITFADGGWTSEFEEACRGWTLAGQPPVTAYSLSAFLPGHQPEPRASDVMFERGELVWSVSRGEPA